MLPLLASWNLVFVGCLDVLKIVPPWLTLPLLVSATCGADDVFVKNEIYLRQLVRLKTGKSPLCFLLHFYFFLKWHHSAACNNKDPTNQLRNSLATASIIDFDLLHRSVVAALLSEIYFAYSLERERKLDCCCCCCFIYLLLGNQHKLNYYSQALNSVKFQLSLVFTQTFLFKISYKKKKANKIAKKFLSPTKQKKKVFQRDVTWTACDLDVDVSACVFRSKFIMGVLTLFIMRLSGLW